MKENQKNDPSVDDQNKPQDEDVGVMIYGSVRIKDTQTGKILVNQRG